MATGDIVQIVNPQGVFEALELRRVPINNFSRIVYAYVMSGETRTAGTLETRATVMHVAGSPEAGRIVESIASTCYREEVHREIREVVQATYRWDLITEFNRVFWRDMDFDSAMDALERMQPYPHAWRIIPTTGLEHGAKVA